MEADGMGRGENRGKNKNNDDAKNGEKQGKENAGDGGPSYLAIAKLREDNACFNCGGRGHTALMCTSAHARGIKTHILECYNCGGTGHVAKDCGSAYTGKGKGRFEGACHACGGE